VAQGKARRILKSAIRFSYVTFVDVFEQCAIAPLAKESTNRVRHNSASKRNARTDNAVGLTAEIHRGLLRGFLFPDRIYRFSVAYRWHEKKSTERSDANNAPAGYPRHAEMLRCVIIKKMRGAYSGRNMYNKMSLCVIESMRELPYHRKERTFPSKSRISNERCKSEKSLARAPASGYNCTKQ